MDKSAELYKQLEDSLLAYDAESAVQAAQSIVDAGLDVKGAIDVATAIINRIGEQFQRGDIFRREVQPHNLVEEFGRLGGGEAQVGGAQFGQLVPDA